MEERYFSGIAQYSLSQAPQAYARVAACKSGKLVLVMTDKEAPSEVETSRQADRA